MPLQGRVGRHARQEGRHCQNWPGDQQAVIALLNRIAVNDGGAGGGLNGNIGGRIVAGMASEPLYRAISTFEDRHFPGQRSGFVDPAGAMLKRMEALAARAATPPANDTAPEPLVPSSGRGYVTSLERLRDNVLIDAHWRHFPASERADFEPLVTMAVRHIDNLLDRGHEKLPWPVEMFGRAHITRDKLPMIVRGSFGFVVKGGDIERPKLPEMRFGSPVDMVADITTEGLGALLLYDSSVCYRVFPWHTGMIRFLQDWNWGNASWTEARPLKR